MQADPLGDELEMELTPIDAVPEAGAEEVETKHIGVTDDSGTKIDYAGYEPIPFKRTSTLVNYFIINTA